MRLKRIMSVLLWMALAVLTAPNASPAGEKVAGKTYYTAVNIWYTKPLWINSTNYIRGKFIPAGTKVTVLEVYDNPSHDVISGSSDPDHWIRFAGGDGVKYKIIFEPKHSAPGDTVWILFRRMFSAEDPRAPGGPFSSLSAEEQENVQQGRIADGMSRNAVLMAYGYPPGHKTPSLQSNAWHYWVNRRKLTVVTFENDKAVLPEAKKTKSEPTGIEKSGSERTGNERTVEERLRTIEELKQKGIITEKEYEKKRAEILEEL